VIFCLRRPACGSGGRQSRAARREGVTLGFHSDTSLRPIACAAPRRLAKDGRILADLESPFRAKPRKLSRTAEATRHTLRPA
jgi:hypothetical protein